MITGRDEEFKGTITFYFNKRLGHPPSAEQMAAYLYACEAGWTGEQVDANLAKEPEAIAYAVRPIAPPVPALSIVGHDFVDASGQVVMLNGVDGFMDLRLFLDGGEDALTPFMDEAKEFRFNLRRIFLQGSKPRNQVMQLDPRAEGGYYEALRLLVDYENRHGIITLLTIGVDNEDIQSPIEHWQRVDEATKGQARILSYFNEEEQNHSSFGSGDIPPASGLWSRGSRAPADTEPHKPTGQVLEFHPRREFQIAMKDAVASPIQMYEVDGFNGPLIIDEPGRMGTNAHDDRFTDPRTVGHYARLLSTLCAGVVMHNYFGQRGQLMDGLTRACAAAWSNGAL